MSYASSLLLKEKEKEIQKKRNIKSGKIDKRKRRMLVSKAFHNRVQHRISSFSSRITTNLTASYITIIITITTTTIHYEST